MVVEVGSQFLDADTDAFTDEILIGDLTGTRSEFSHSGRTITQKRKYCRYMSSDIRVSMALGRIAFRQKWTVVQLVDVS